MFESLNEAPRTDGRYELSIMNHTGDTKVVWDPDNPDEVAAAKIQFDTLKGKGFAAFRVQGPKGEQGEQITEFDPKAVKMILIPPMRGG